ncbi:MAG: transcription antitermination factor NusB [Ichthyobacteriaceae bacterium]|nr:transcription antitermination factor NusB [Ichthyobacteriaceae bacterium]
MQSVYSFVQSDKDRVDVEQRNLSKSIDDIYDLYILMLDLVVEVVQWEKHTIDGRKKSILGEEILVPDERLANNEFVHKLGANINLQEAVENRGFNWRDNDEYLRSILKDIKNSELYAKYIRKSEHTFKSHKNFMIDLFKDVIAPNEKIHEYIEDRNIAWIGDIAVANGMALKTLTVTFEDSKDKQPLMTIYKDADDKKYAKDLFTKTVLHLDKTKKIITDKTPGWDPERIAQLDLIMMQMGLTEFLYFPSIPAKVTINEYLEISKDFSTEKSKIFVNGVLDKALKELTAQGEISKSGRGLV